ncbi:ABC transporter ATP-binding protein [Gracilibacillus sp. S3-1-1]|uniref:ABC transporter ATP-binding protein n=1 Tax=Gracilibacillus pellucidus TaxID=3095368 RepID=A0ACC6M152_9BACI|nr:ABC transporter ATP-binding protein [Gracilibacillus sp. S3-1-1]MDX8044679.1 ABC transporter ATP-binding protein [Gracilibacillus sp. S3-1-1]
MIDAQSVSKSYGSVQALNNLQFQIDAGSCFGLVGPNGAGKSTFIKILVGILQKFDGDIQVFNKSVKQRRLAVKNFIGYVPQDICLEEFLTAKGNLIYFGKLYGLSGEHLRKRIHTVLDQIGLTDKANQKVTEFSGGMKRSLNIGCAILHQPSLVVLDEPTVGIDPQSRHAIFNLIQQLKEKGSTVIYSSHYMEEVEQICNSVGFIDKGKLVEHGSMQHVLNKHRNASIFISADGISKEELSVYGETIEQKNGFTVNCDDPLLTMGKMVEQFWQNGINPERLELSHTRLEDIFFYLTGTQLRDNG